MERGSDIRSILRAGADKVAINTAAVQQPELITLGAEQFGVQCVVVAIDAKRRTSAGGEHFLVAVGTQPLVDRFAGELRMDAKGAYALFGELIHLPRWIFAERIDDGRTDKNVGVLGVDLITLTAA